MSAAEIEHVAPDPERGREFLRQAQRFLSDSEADISLEGATILSWNACISAMDAVLAHVGRRVTSGTHGHAIRVRECSAIMGPAHDELFDRMDVWRRDRGGVSYGAVQPSANLVASMSADARDLVDAVEAFLR